MVFESIIEGLLEGFGMAVRVCAATAAFFLILRSVAAKLSPYFPRLYNGLLFRYTDIFVMPVRKVLPASVCNRKVDYSPLISAIILLFLGLGINTFIRIIVKEL